MDYAWKLPFIHKTPYLLDKNSKVGSELGMPKRIFIKDLEKIFK